MVLHALPQPSAGASLVISELEEQLASVRAEEDSVRARREQLEMQLLQLQRKADAATTPINSSSGGSVVSRRKFMKPKAGAGVLRVRGTRITLW